MRCIHVDPSPVDAAPPPPPPAVPIVRDGVGVDYYSPLRKEEDPRSELLQQKGERRTAQAGEGVREGGAVRRRHSAVHVHPRGPDEDFAGQEQGHTEEHPPVVLSGSEDRCRRSERVREGTSSRQFIASRHSSACDFFAVENISKPPARPHYCSRRSSRSWRGSRRSSTASHVHCRALP